MSAMITQLLSSGKFCKLHYDTIPDRSAPVNVSIPITQKCQILSFDTLVTNGQYNAHARVEGIKRKAD